MGFENCDVGFEKKNELGNGIGRPLQDPLSTATKHKTKNFSGKFSLLSGL